MWPLSSLQPPSETHPAFEDAAEAWLLRSRNPLAGTEVLEAVQRRQAHQDHGAPAAALSPPADVSAMPPPPGTAQLRRLKGEQKTDLWFLSPGRPLVIGRSGKSLSPVDVDLWPDTGISRRHAMLWCDGTSWWVEDLRSKNGTFITGMDIRGQRAVRLEPGMTLRLGRTELTLDV